MHGLGIGAVGKTGGLVVERALAAGHGVMSRVYSSGGVKHPPPPEVRVVHGDVHDLEAEQLTMVGRDAVIATLGGERAFLKTDIESSGAGGAGSHACGRRC